MIFLLIYVIALDKKVSTFRGNIMKHIFENLSQLIGSVRGFTSKKVRHKSKTVEFYSHFIRNGDLCFDVGANMGNRTEIFLKLGAKVVCIEPQQICLQKLYKLFGKNKNVIIVDKAVGCCEGYGELAICEAEHTISTMSDKWIDEGRFSKHYRWTERKQVPITTIDTLISLYGRPAFCKIDVEGFEEQVLRGLTRPISLISFEFTREFFDDAKNCINYLLSIGRFKFNCSLGESMNLLSTDWVEPDELYEKVDSLDDEFLWGDVYAKLL